MNLKIGESNTKTVLAILTVLFFLGTILWANLGSSLLSNKLEDKVDALLNQQLDNKVKINDIQLKGLNKVIIKGIDLKGDYESKLLGVNQLQISYSLFDLIFNSFNIIESIKRIDVISPKVSLVKEKEWNYQSLLDQINIIEGDKKEGSKRNYSFSIYIKEGSLNYKTADFAEVVENIAAKIDIGTENIFEVKANIPNLSEDRLEVKGAVVGDKYQGNLRFAHLKLANLKKYLKMEQLEGVKWTGKATGYLQLAGFFDDKINYQASINLEEGTISKDDVKIREIAAKFGINKYGVKINDLTAEYKDLPLKVAGNIYGWDKIQLDLEYSSEKINLEQINDLVPYNLKIDGQASLAGSVKGNLDNPSLDGTIQMVEAEVADLKLEDINSQFYYKDKLINLENLSFKHAKGEVRGRGTISLDEKLNYIFSTSISNIDLSQISPLLKYNDTIEGIVNGDTMISGVGLDKNSLNILGEVSIAEADINKYQIKELNGNFWLSEGKFFLDHTRLVTEKSRANLDGIITLDGDLNLTIKADNIVLNDLKDTLKAEDLTGIANLDGKVIGRIKQPRFSGKFNLEDFKYNRFSIGDATGGLELTKDRMNLNEVKLNQLATTVSGGIDLNNYSSDLILDTKEVSGAKLLNSLGITIPVTGIASGKAEIKEIYPNFSISGNAVVRNGLFFEQNFDQANLNFAYKDQKFIISASEAFYNNSRLTADGYYKNKNLEFNFSTNNLALADIDYYNFLELGFSGIAQGEGKLFGNISDLKVSGGVNSDQIAYNGVKLGNLSGQLSYGNQHLYLSDVNLQNNNNKYKGTGNINIAERKIEGILVDIEEGSLEFINELIPFDLNLPYKFKGRLKITDQLTKPTFDADLKFSDNLEEGYLITKGNYTLNGNMDLDLLAKGFNLQEFNNLSIIDYQLGGRLDLTATLKGNLEELNLDSKIKLSQGSMNNFNYEKLSGDFKVINSKRIELDQVLRIEGNNIVMAQGDIPLDSKEEFDLDLTLKEGNLSLLPLITDKVKAATGKGKAKFHLDGSRDKMRLTGEAEVLSGNILSPFLDRKITNLSGRIEAQGDKIQINQLSGDYGSGEFRVNGDIGLDGIQPKKYNLSFGGKNIFVEHGFWQGFNSGNLTITGPFKEPLLKGDITVNDTRLDLSFDWPRSDSEGVAMISPEFDLNIYPGKNVSIGNANIDILIQSGNLNLKTVKKDSVQDNGVTKGYQLTGKLSSTNGQVSYYNTEFRLERATAIFNKHGFDKNSLIPNLDIRAQTTVQEFNSDNDDQESSYEDKNQDIDVTLRLSGLATKMNLSITSTPNRSKKEIIQLLTGQSLFDNIAERDYQGALQEEMWRVINQNLQNQLISKVERSFEKSFDLDQVRIKSVLNGDLRLELGKFVTDDLMLKYNQTFGVDDERLYGFEYHFSKGLDNLQFVGNYNSNREYKFGLNATIPF